MTEATSITVRVPLTIRRRPGRKTVVTRMTEGVAPVTTRADPALVKALARAFRYQKLLDEERYASISEMAKAEKIDRGYLGSLLRLTLLAPDIVEAVLSGKLTTLSPLPLGAEDYAPAWQVQTAIIPLSEHPAGQGRSATSCRFRLPGPLSCCHTFVGELVG